LYQGFSWVALLSGTADGSEAEDEVTTWDGDMIAGTKYGRGKSTVKGNNDAGYIYVESGAKKDV